MDDYRKVLRRVGWVLVVFGLLDVAAMAYCITHQISYSSSFNIFAVVAGIYLVKGSLRAARVVAWFSALYLTIFGLMPMLFFWKSPPDGTWHQAWEAAPVAFVASVAFLLGILGLLGWTYWQLRQPVVLQARSAAGLDTAPPYVAFALGGAFILSFVVMLRGVPLTVAGGALRPRKEATVVLQKEPLVLQPGGTNLLLSEPLEVQGGTSSICVVLKSGVDSGPQVEMDRAFKASLGASQITISFTRADGQNFSLKATNQAWWRSGEITGDSELAACSSCGCAKPSCEELFPTGARFSAVKVASSPPMEILGVYWTSTNAFDQPDRLPPAPARSASSQPLPPVTYGCGTGHG